MKTTTPPAATIRNALAGATGPDAERLTRELDALDAATATGTARAWFRSHHGGRVDTVQVSEWGGWAPLDREVDASRATYVTLGGSRRDYTGVRVVAATPTAILVETDDATIMYAYRS